VLAGTRACVVCVNCMTYCCAAASSYMSQGQGTAAALASPLVCLLQHMRKHLLRWFGDSGLSDFMLWRHHMLLSLASTLAQHSCYRQAPPMLYYISKCLHSLSPSIKSLLRHILVPH
jgi:hypothetical protein